MTLYTHTGFPLPLFDLRFELSFVGMRGHELRRNWLQNNWDQQCGECDLFEPDRHKTHQCEYCAGVRRAFPSIGRFQYSAT